MAAAARNISNDDCCNSSNNSSCSESSSFRSAVAAVFAGSGDGSCSTIAFRTVTLLLLMLIAMVWVAFRAPNHVMFTPRARLEYSYTT